MNLLFFALLCYFFTFICVMSFKKLRVVSNLIRDKYLLTIKNICFINNESRFFLLYSNFFIVNSRFFCVYPFFSFLYTLFFMYTFYFYYGEFKILFYVLRLYYCELNILFYIPYFFTANSWFFIFLLIICYFEFKKIYIIWEKIQGMSHIGVLHYFIKLVLKGVLLRIGVLNFS